MRVAVIINPIAGSRRRDAGRRRAELAVQLLSAHLPRLAHEILVTERVGHAFDLAQGAVRRGATVVCAWGGDGTVNEIAAALLRGPVPLAIIPAGSGNGLARELKIPFAAAAAFAVATGHVEHCIDVGELGGRLFVNVAGIGFDAAIATRFAEGESRRGFARYGIIAASELGSYRRERYVTTAAGVTQEMRAWMIVLANSRQYGNGAVIAPRARPDDGLLELVVVHDQPAWRIAIRAIELFKGTLDERSGVSFQSIEAVSITGDAPMRFHVDGEPVQGGTRLDASVHASVLRVKVPADYSTNR